MSQRILGLERVPCCFCGGFEGATCYTGRDTEFKTCANLFRFIRCADCGHIYLAERPTAEDIPRIYDGYLTSNRRSPYYPSKLVIWLKDQLFDRVRMRHVLRHLHDGSQVLDIGAGAGRLLRLLRRISKKRVHLYANDYSFDPVTRAELESDEIEMIVGPIEACATDCRFDAITGIHVIEHVSHARQTMEWIAGHLTPGGVLYLETPDAGALMARLFGSRWGMLHFPRHFNLFTTAKLAQLVTGSGLKVVRHGHTTGAPAWNMSVRNLLGLDALARAHTPLELFNYSNIATLGAFTVLDLALLSVGVPTSTQQIVAVK
jgi:2-polyprenyl-3-methyl-5-hydroxy-6-metoxy-1,4-benzoquinol methylase